MRPTRWTAVVAAAAALTLGACGVRDDLAGGVAVATVASPAFLADAADRTTAAGTGRFETTVEMTGLPGPTGAARMTGAGAYDTDAGLASLTMDLSELASAMGESGMGGSIETVVDGTVVYIRLPAGAGVEGATWMKVDTQTPGGFGQGPTPFGAQSDPRALLDFLRGAGADVETVGTEDVRDVPTTHLRATLSVDAIVAQAPDETRDQLEAALGNVSGAGGAPSFPVDVWIDGEGLVRRVRLAMETPVPGGTAGSEAAGPVGITVTTDYFAFGEPVTIEVPSPDEVADLSEGFGGSGGDEGEGD